MNTHCIECKQPFRKIGVFADTVIQAGDIYSEASEREAQISGYCEHCFDDMFSDDDDEEFDQSFFV